MMRKGLVSALATLAVLAALFAWIKIAKPFERRVPSLSSPFSRPLISVDSSAISRLSLTRREGGGYVLVRKGDDYQLEGRPGLRLSRSRVESALESAGTIEALGEIDAEPKNPADFGLDRPGLLRLIPDNGPVRELEIGARSPGGEVYVRVPGQRMVYSASSAAIDAFYIEADDFRERTLASIDSKKLRYILIRRPDSTLEIEDRPAGSDVSYLTTMCIIKPFRHVYPVSIDGMNSLAAGLPPMFEIKGFAGATKSLAECGLDPPAMELVIRDETTSLHLFTGGSAGDDIVYARLAGESAIFTMEKSAIDFALKADPLRLVNRLPLLIPIDHVDRLSFRMKEKTFQLDIERRELPLASGAGEGGKPVIGTGYFANRRPLDEATFKEIYRRVISIAIEGINPRGPGDPTPSGIEATATFWPKGGLPGRTFDFVPFDSDYYALYFEGDSEFLVTKQQVKKVTDRLEAALGGLQP